MAHSARPNARWIPATELVVGDVVTLGSEIVRVLEEPMVHHRGLSPFDQLEFFLETPVQPLDGHADPTYHRSPADALVLVHRSG